MNITIAPYENKYQNQTANLILSIQNEEFNLDVNINDRDDLQNIKQTYTSQETSNFWLALYNNNVIGTISILDITKKRLALQNMYIHKDFRGTIYNTATKLLKQTINFAYENKMKEIYLGTGNDFYAAHKFYEKNGFMEVSKESLPSTFPFMSIDNKFYELIL